MIGTMAAAEMRKMMEGVVLFGTGKPAQLNGYSAGGKTGTAQKIDPATHTYSKTMHIASFAGFAPVNNPVISIAVVIDSPHGDYYGTAVSAPVFAEVAQQVLEYLGVPHDTDLQPVKTPSTKDKPVKEDEASSDTGDINALYAAVNDLPNDDPLRAAPAPPTSASAPPTPAAKDEGSHANVKSGASPATASPAAQSTAISPSSNPSSVILAEGAQVQVPSFVGLTVRQVIEQAGRTGLEVEIVGNGTARAQAPAPGDMVRPGTKLVVRCGR